MHIIRVLLSAGSFTPLCKKVRHPRFYSSCAASLLVALLVIVSGCGEQGAGLTPYPFKDGDYLVYEKKQENTPATITRTFRVESSGSGFIVRRLQAVSLPNGERAETRLTSSEKVYDKYGRLQKLADGRSGGRCRGNFCFLWLPPDKRSVGSELPFSEIATPVSVSESVTRGNRTVLVIHDRNTILYYDAMTGLLVDHSFFGPLTDTNRKDLL